MKIEDPQNQLTQRLKTDLSETTGENLLDGIIRSTYTEFVKSVTETSSKVRQPKTYNEAISNSVYRNK